MEDIWKSKEVSKVRKGDKIIITYKTENGLRRHVETINEEPTMTQQQHKDECDVNQIIAKYERTGTISHVNNASQGVYMDLTELPDFQEALHTVIAAQNAFEEVPAQIRQRFGHDPKQFIDFLADEANTEEAIKLGLRSRPTPPPEDPILTTLNNIDKNTKPKSKKSETENLES